ncbi:lytic transglycosylase domain-containing protein [Bordetella genomosp. 9]|uniref:Lytic transglycosylase n=1 Tax=Bordetella genomosp. 9 TaxID=1416803 RepID=A0A1W6YX06_9BORD|nr:lytic transglycosylase domain-containing protein [Bordetella genomosp. 9]ARP85531.1 lytic transglycosylase [Bordetella genomosp. 9]
MRTQWRTTESNDGRRWLFLMTLALGLMLALAVPRAQAGEIYRYKDPFGNWRSMIVDKGMARTYKRAQARAAVRKGGDARCTECARRYTVGGPAVRTTLAAAGRQNDARLEALSVHRGLDDYRSVIAKAAADSGLDSALLGAVIAVESGFRKDARSPKGALGLMQLMPDTAAALLGDLDVERALVDPAINVRAGSRHLRSLIDQYPGRLDLALAAYNAGQGAVQKYDGIPPYAETQQYVRDVIALYARYKAGW